MPSSHIRALAFSLLATAVAAIGAQAPPPARPWPPDVQKSTGGAPVLSPAEALATFSLPPGFRLELVASEPMIQDPIMIEWDPAGRLWAIELTGYMRDILASGEHDPTSRVVVLEDTDNDGTMDRRTVFADGLVQPRALRVLRHGVLVGDPPNVWLLQDTDGDLRADSREPVASNYGRPDTNVEVNANGLLWALDNRMYTAGTGADLYLRLTNGMVEAQPSLSRGQWGVTQDDAGRIFRNHNESVLHVDLVPTPYFARNPNLLRRRGSHDVLVDETGDVNAVWPARQTPGTNRAYQHGVLREDGTLAAFTAAGAPTVYRGDRLPADLQGNVFVTEPAANLVSRIVLHDDGTTLRARKAYHGAEFLTSVDERFRPVNLSSGPDGTLYIVDMYRGLIQHRAYITEYLRDQIVARKLEAPIGFGRVYRVVHETTTRDTAPSLSRASSAALVDTLSHPNGWWRDTAQQLLVERRDTGVAPALVKMARSAQDWRTRLHALWTLDGIDAVDPPLVTAALSDPSREVRAAAIRVAERWLGDGRHPIHKAVLARAEDGDWGVRQQLAASLGAMPPGPREDAVVALLERYADDPVTLDAALSGISGSEALVLDGFLSARADRTPQREAAVTLLAATVMRSGPEAAIQKVLASAADDTRARWERSALLHGAEIALLSVPMPGMVQPRRSAAAVTAAPCPTCPGGRAGPGGAYAFARPPAAAGGGTGRGAGPGLRLVREPLALTEWARRGGEFGSRAAAVVARITWPGKVGDPAPVPALTPEEQRRFDAGQEVYRSICQACHQPDGRGQERLAPTLIGSGLTLASPDIPVRILLNGKEGPVGLMPPIGGALTDDQIADVLTYVRREWGQTGTPVEPATVKTTRALTANRTRPWTHDELTALLNGRP